MNMDDKKIDELINKALQEEQALPEGLSRRLEKQIDSLGFHGRKEDPFIDP